MSTTRRDASGVTRGVWGVQTPSNKIPGYATAHTHRIHINSYMFRHQGVIFRALLQKASCRGQLKCDGTHAETRFRLSGRNGRVHLNRPVGGVSSVDCWQPRCAPSAVVMLDTPCSEVVWRVLATHCIRQFPLHFPSRASPCAITFQLESISIMLGR